MIDSPYRIGLYLIDMIWRYGSFKNFQVEYLSDFVIMRIFLSNPAWMIFKYLLPKPVSQIRMKLPIGMESIASLN